MKKYMGRIILLILPIILIANYNTFSSDKNKEEAIFGLKYQSFTEDFLVFTQEKEVYLPLDDFLFFLKIFHSVDNNIYEGYINNADSSFYIDFQKQEYKNINQVKHKLTADEWFQSDFQFYINTSVLSKIFDLNIKNYFNMLVVNVKAKYELPVLRSMKAEYISNNFSRKNTCVEDAPLIQENKFEIINGGSLDYSIGSSFGNGIENYRLSSNLGLQVLGGELQYGFGGSSNNNILDYRNTYRWRYLIDNDYINSISLGQLNNPTLRNNVSRGYMKPYYKITGLQFTNNTYNTPKIFTNYIIEDIVEPEWNVELYINDQLFDAQKADLNGFYHFELPIAYGLTNIEVKYYGKKGEYLSSNEVLNIPAEFLSAGDFKYYISGGEDDFTKNFIIDASVASGVTDWFTNTISSSKLFQSDNLTIVNQSSINLFYNAVLNFTVTNTGVYECGLKLPQSLLGNLEIFYTSIDKSIKSSNFLNGNTLNILSTMNRIFGLPITMSLTGRRVFKEQSNSNNLNTSLSSYFNNISLSLRYNLIFEDKMNQILNKNQTLDASITYSVSSLPKFISFLGRPRFSLSSSYIPDNNEFTNITFGFQQDITNKVYLRGDYSYNLRNKMSYFKMGLSMNLTNFRSNFNANFYNSRQASYSTDLSGSLEFDSHNLSLSFINSTGASSLYGRSSAAIKFFEDKNLNGIFDGDDELIPEVDFTVTKGMVKKIRTNGYQTLNNLRPGFRYNIKVNPVSFPNPSLIPSITEFSFIAEPYSYKAIDIPCQIGGMVEGAATRESPDGKMKAQGGLKIHIVAKDDSFARKVNVFSDGSYFYVGLPIGKYKVYVDSTQQDILNCFSEPAIREFSIKSTPDGDYVSNLDFTLRPITEISEGDRLVTAAPSNPSIESIPPRQGDSSETGNQYTARRYFGYSSLKEFMPTKEMVAYLKEIIAYHKEDPDANILVAAYILDKNSAPESKELVDKRTDVVVNYLISNGVDVNYILANAEIISDKETIPGISIEKLEPGIVNIQIVK